jgi:hypothetical protein
MITIIIVVLVILVVPVFFVILVSVAVGAVIPAFNKLENLL